MDRYNVEKYVVSILDKDYAEIVVETEREAGAVEPQSYSRTGAVAARMRGSCEYATVLKGFLFFMRYGIKPDGVHNWDFAKFRPICERLVEKGQFLPSVLDHFKHLESV